MDKISLIQEIEELISDLRCKEENKILTGLERRALRILDEIKE